MPRVLISDALSDRAVAVFESRGVDVDVDTGLAPAALAARIGAYDGLAVRSSTKVTERVLAAANGLRVIGRAGIGVDNIDVRAATARGVVVMNTPFGNSVTTAEHTLALMLALARRIPQADRSTQGRRVAEGAFHRQRARRQDPGADRLRQHRLHRRRARAGAEDAHRRPRPLSRRRARGGAQCREGDAGTGCSRAPT